MKKNFLKTIIAATLLIAPILTTLPENNVTVQAASWHKGMPKVLHGNWRGHGMVLKISNKHVYFMPKTGASVSKAKRLVYRKHGKKTYQYHITWKDGGSYTGTIKMLNRRTVRFNGYTLKK